MTARLFTIDEAEAFLPRVQELLSTMRTSLSFLKKHAASLGLPAQSDLTSWVGDHVVAHGYWSQLQGLSDAHRELDSMGIQVKDVEEGLIDFPARYGDKLVLLCWKDGEERIAWFHDIKGGYSGRRPIAELLGPVA